MKLVLQLKSLAAPLVCFLGVPIDKGSPSLFSSYPPHSLDKYEFSEAFFFFSVTLFFFSGSPSFALNAYREGDVFCSLFVIPQDLVADPIKYEIQMFRALCRERKRVRLAISWIWCFPFSFSSYFHKDLS